MEQLELTTTGILALFETDKSQRQSFVTDLVGRIEDGEIDPLKAHLQIKAMEDIITQLTSLDEKKNKNVEAAKKYRSFLLSNAEKYGKSFDLHNAKFEIKETGSSYDFSKCNDTEHAQLSEQMNELKKKIKAREDFLKTVPLSGLTITDTETGETTTVYPPAKSSTTSVTVRLN